MSVADRLTSEFTDTAAGYLRAGNWISKLQSAAALAAATQAATNGNLLFQSRGDAIVGTATPSTAALPLVTDLAQFNFATAAGGRVVYVVPAPVQAMFTASGTIDITNALAAAVIAAVLAALTDVTGSPATLFTGGLKISRRTEQNG